jgi:hypothetical protein
MLRKGFSAPGAFSIGPPCLQRLALCAPSMGSRSQLKVRRDGPGRDGPFGPPPGQNPASRFPAPGSHLWVNGSESVSPAKDVESPAWEAESVSRSV